MGWILLTEFFWKMSSCREQTNTGILVMPYPCPVSVPTNHLATYPQGLQVREVGLGAEKHIVCHAEALTYTKVVEQGGLCQGGRMQLQRTPLKEQGALALHRVSSSQGSRPRND